MEGRRKQAYIIKHPNSKHLKQNEANVHVDYEEWPEIEGRH